MTKLDLDKAKALNTKRLLAYYKKYGNSWLRKFTCDCGCGELNWVVWNSCAHEEAKYEAEKRYWESIKEILNKREHVEI